MISTATIVPDGKKQNHIFKFARLEKGTPIQCLQAPISKPHSPHPPLLYIFKSQTGYVSKVTIVVSNLPTFVSGRVRTESERVRTESERTRRNVCKSCYICQCRSPDGVRTESERSPNSHRMIVNRIRICTFFCFVSAIFV